jgi:hypothetical protein
VSYSGLAVRGNASAADRDFKEGLARTVARPGAAAERISIPDYACRRSHRTAVDAGSIPAASILRLNQALSSAYPHHAMPPGQVGEQLRAQTCGRAVAGLVSSTAMKLFGRKRGTDGRQAEVYAGLRQQALHLTSGQLGDAFTGARILALLMETGYTEAVATLVGVADGTTSLYFSNGGGIIGAGTHATVADANRRWLESGLTFLPEFPVFTDPALRGEGITQFVVVTPDGLRGVAVPEHELGDGQHHLSPFFYAAQEVITQIRLTQGG